MPDLRFEVRGAEAVSHAVSPQLAFKLRIENAGAELIQTVALRCQILIEVARRPYTPQDQERLRDLFGEPKRWSETLRSLLWTHTSLVVPPFTGATDADLPAPCSFDFNVAAVKYFEGLDAGEIPLCLQFSGTVFYQNGGLLQVAPIPWDREARFRLPLKVWREMMDHYYPNTAWLGLRRDVFDRLYQFKVRHGIPTWEATVEQALDEAEEVVRQ